MGPSSSCRWCVAALITGLALLLTAPTATATPPLVGGAGMARYFRGQEFTADIATARLSLPIPAVTVELWVRLSDVYRRQALFSYGAVDDRTTALVTHELEVLVDPQRVHVVHKSSAALQVFHCQTLRADVLNATAMCSTFRLAEWTHVALTLNAATADLKLYLNGTMVMDVRGDGVTLTPGQDPRVLRIPLVGNGAVLFGQNPTRFMDDFEKGTQSSVFLDEMRIWKTERTQEEIQTWMHHVELPAEQHAQLVADWHLDEPVEEPRVEPDGSGNGHDLYVGSFDTAVQTVAYTTSPAMRPTHPSLVVSTAELWGGPLGAVVSSEGVATIHLRSMDNSGAGNLTTIVTRPPLYGTLRLDDNAEEGTVGASQQTVVRELAGPSVIVGGSDWPTVVYEALHGQPFTNDSFEYTVANSAGESATALVILLPETDSPMGMQGVSELLTSEKATRFLPYAGFTRGGIPLRLDITANPIHGALIRAVQETVVVGGLPEIIVAGGEQVGAAPEEVEDPSKYLGYVAPAYVLGAEMRDSFALCWRTEDQSLSFNKTIEVRITAVNDKPVIEDQEATVAHGMVSLIGLEGDDAENDTIFYTILDPPSHGKFYHGDGGEPMGWDLNPVVLQNAEFIPPFNANWGPAWSFQWSPCPCCMAQATCALPDVGGGGDIEVCSCSYSDYSVAQVLGKFNAFPRTTVAPTAWSPFRIGDHFIVVGFHIPVHISAIKVYELLTPNRIARLSAASVYAGNTTDWTVLYQRATRAPIEGEVNVFDPPLCPAAETPFRYVRIDISIATQEEMYYMIDALEVLGTVEPPHGLLRAGGTSLGYRPPAGVHGDVEAVRFAARDCSNSADEPRTLRIRVEPPSDVSVSDVVEGEPIAITAIIGGETSAQIPIELFAALLPPHLSNATLSHVDLLFPDSDDFWPHVIIPEDTEPLMSDKRQNHVVGARSPSGAFILACAVTHLHEVGGSLLQAWVTFTAPDQGNITFRGGVEVAWVCDTGVSPTMCADKPADCAVLGSDWVLDPEEGRCVYLDSGRKLTVSLSVGLSILFLSIIIAALFQLRRLARRAKVLQEQLTSQLGSSDKFEIDADAPLLKIMDFLDKLAYEEGGSVNGRGEGLFGCCGALPGHRNDTSTADIKAEARQLYHVLTSGKSLLSPDLRGQMARAAGAVSDLPIADDGAEANLPELARFLVDNMTNSAVEGSMKLGKSLSMRRVSGYNSATGLPSIRDTTSLLERSAEQVLSVFDTGEAQALQSVGLDLTCDIFAVSAATGGRPLAAVALKAVQELQLQSLISQKHWDTFARFLCRIESAYRNVPYHNSTHAADVTARISALLLSSGIWEEGMGECGKMSMLATILAAVVHDVGHPGTNNSYHVAHCTKYAEDWNNHKVLENYSVHYAFILLSDPQCNFTEDWSVHKFQRLRRLVISLVLATDFADHFDYLTKFKAKVGENTRIDWSEQGQAEQQLILQVAIKVADLGHCASPIKAHLDWVQRLQEEYFTQGDLELESGMPISALMDRTKDGVNCSISQLGFFDVVALPLFTSWVERFPGAMPLLEQASLNRRHWQDEKASGRAGSSGNPLRVITSNRNLPRASGGLRRSSRANPSASGECMTTSSRDNVPAVDRSKARGHSSESGLPPAPQHPDSTYIDIIREVEAPSLEARSFTMEQELLAKRPTDDNSMTEIHK